MTTTAVRAAPARAAAAQSDLTASASAAATAASGDHIGSSSDSDDDDSLSLDALLAFCEGRASLASTEEHTHANEDNHSSDALPLAPQHSDTNALDGRTQALPQLDSGGGSVPSAPAPERAHEQLRTDVHEPVAAAPRAHHTADSASRAINHHADAISSSDNQLEHLAATSYETDASAKSSSSFSASSPGAMSSSTPEQEPQDEAQRLREIRLGKRQRQRQRQRDELKYLGLRVAELERELAHLRDHHDAFTAETAAAAARLEQLMGSSPSTLALSTGVWHQTAHVEREALRTSVMENTRLRAQFECQLQIANGLKRLYEHQGSAVRCCCIDSLTLCVKLTYSLPLYFMKCHHSPLVARDIARHWLLAQEAAAHELERRRDGLCVARAGLWRAVRAARRDLCSCRALDVRRRAHGRDALAPQQHGRVALL